MTNRLPILSLLLPALSVAPAALLAAALIFPQAASAEPARAKLTLTISNIKEHKGALSLGIYDAAGYETDKAVNGGSIPVTGATVTATFDLPPGQYGIKMFHDVDGDGKPDIILADQHTVQWYQNPTWKKHVIAENLTKLDHVCVAAQVVDGKCEIAVGAERGAGPGAANHRVVGRVCPP
jgi:hypothetical protein